MEGYAVSEFIGRDFPAIQQVKFNDTLSGLEALSLGNIDAYIDVLSVGAYLAASHGMSNVQVAASTPYQHDFAIGVRKDWPELVEILNLAIERLPMDQKNHFLRKWLAIKFETRVDYTLLYWVIVFALLVVGFLIYRARIMSRLNAHLREWRERQTLTLEGAQLGTFELRFQPGATTEFEWDETFARHHNFPSDQPHFDSSKTFFRYIDPSQSETVRAQLHSFIKGETEQFRIEYQTHDSSAWIAVQGRILERDSNGRARRMVGISQDITQNKEAEAAILRSSEFKSQFLANMSHEIRTPMNAIVGLSHLLSQLDLTTKQLDYVNKLKKSSYILLALIDDILDFSKIEAGHLKIDNIDFDLQTLLDDLAGLTVVRLPDKDIEFLYDMDPSVPRYLSGDPFRLNQVLNNLISNAVKFTEQGHIVLKVTMEERIGDSTWLKFSVSDTGIGIDKEKLDLLFEAFVQADGSTTRKYGGTGLGLSISKQLCQLMGGDLNARSEKGQGSEFFFRLPFNPSSHDRDERLLTPPDVDLHGLRILLVDDNLLALKVIKETLRSLKFEVTACSSGTEALTILGKSPRFDLVLLDWRMPDLDGEQTAVAIHRDIDPAAMPLIILMTAYGKEALDHIHQATLDGLLVKPVTPSSLFDAIAEARLGPRGIKPSTASRNHDQQFPVIPLRGHVLLAEDNPINQQVAHDILRRMGLEVTLCDNGVQVLELLQSETPDLILMDIQMPEMDGYETTARVHALAAFKDLPIIAMTANAMTDDVERSFEAGMQGHINKPVEPALLYRTLGQYLQTGATDRQPEALRQEGVALPWPDRIDGLDIERGIKQVGGNEALYQKLLRDFLKHHGHLSDELKTLHLDHRDQFERAVHTLKGVSANIGADRLHAISDLIDLKTRAGEPIDEELFSEFSLACNELCRGLQELFASAQPACPLPGEDTRESLTAPPTTDELMRALRSGDARSRELLGGLSAQLVTRFGKTEINVLQSLLNDYEFDRAADKLQDMLGRDDK